MITKQLLNALRADVDAALAQLATKHGLQALKLGKGTYDPHAGTFTFKMNGALPGSKSPEAIRYEANADMLGLPALGFRFTSGGDSFTVTGLNLTGTKVHCARQDGAGYLFPVLNVKRHAARATS